MFNYSTRFISNSFFGMVLFLLFCFKSRERIVKRGMLLRIE